MAKFKKSLLLWIINSVIISSLVLPITTYFLNNVNNSQTQKTLVQTNKLTTKDFSNQLLRNENDSIDNLDNNEIDQTTQLQQSDISLKLKLNGVVVPQDSSQNVTFNSKVNLDVELSVANNHDLNLYDITYQWQKENGLNNYLDLNSSSSNTSLYTIERFSRTNVGKYKITVSVTKKTSSETDSSVVFEPITKNATINIALENAPNINSVSLTSNLPNENIRYKNTVILSASVDTTLIDRWSDIEYVWYKNDQEIQKGKNLTSYVINNFTHINNGNYKVIAKYNDSGTELISESTVLNLAINNEHIPQINNLTIETNDFVNHKINLGSTVTLQPKYDLTSVTEDQLLYEWRKNDSDTIISANKTHTINNFSNNDVGYYQLKISHRIHNEVTSSNIYYLSIDNNNDVVINDFNIKSNTQIAKHNQTVILTANVISNHDLPSNITYNWKFQKAKTSNVVDVDLSQIKSVNKTSILTIKNFNKDNAGTYSVSFMFNNKKYEQTIVVEFDQYSQPEVKSVVINANKSTVDYYGDTIINAEVSLQNLQPNQLRYKWYKNGTIIEGENKNSLRLTNVTEDATYKLAVSIANNPNHEVVSNAILIKVSNLSFPSIDSVVLVSSSTWVLNGTKLVLFANIIGNISQQDANNILYTFKKDNRPIQVSNSAKYEVLQVSDSDGGSYSVEVSFKGRTIISQLINIIVDKTNQIDIDNLTINLSKSAALVNEEINLEAIFSSSNIDLANLQEINYQWEKNVAGNWIKINSGNGDAYKKIKYRVNEQDFNNTNYVDLRLTISFNLSQTPIRKTATEKIYKQNIMSFDINSPFTIEANYAVAEKSNNRNYLNASYLIAQNQKVLILPNLLLDNTIDQSTITFQWSKLNSNNQSLVISNNKILTFNNFSSDDFGTYILDVKLGSTETIQARVVLNQTDFLPEDFTIKIEENEQVSNFFQLASQITKQDAFNYLKLTNIDPNQIEVVEVIGDDLWGTLEIKYILKSNNTILKNETLQTIIISGFFSSFYLIIFIICFIVAIVIIGLLGLFFVKRSKKMQPVHIIHKPVARLSSPPSSPYNAYANGNNHHQKQNKQR